MGRTGTFLCIHAQLERVKTEGVVDIFQFIKSSRIHRPSLVSEKVRIVIWYRFVYMHFAYAPFRLLRDFSCGIAYCVRAPTMHERMHAHDILSAAATPLKLFVQRLLSRTHWHCGFDEPVVRQPSVRAGVGLVPSGIYAAAGRA